ncbi:MAG: hypothetical protein NVSMB10_05860 [Steroidobacteraceae bacterium]
MRRPSAVVFSHGKESGPWGSKIAAMAGAVRALGMEADSVDYRGLDDPRDRIAKLIKATGRFAGSCVLVGSSMGGHVCAAAAAQIQPVGLFLLAPAFYMEGLESQTPHDVSCPTVLVHGWRDDVVPVEHSIRWARERRAALHILDSDHRMQDQLAVICRLLTGFLTGT